LIVILSGACALSAIIKGASIRDGKGAGRAKNRDYHLKSIGCRYRLDPVEK